MLGPAFFSAARWLNGLRTPEFFKTLHTKLCCSVGNVFVIVFCDIFISSQMHPVSFLLMKLTLLPPRGKLLQKTWNEEL